jgi:tryptophanyl-tRNA synthetase
VSTGALIKAIVQELPPSNPFRFLSWILITMASELPKAENTVPVVLADATQEPKAAANQEQKIDPWSVDAGTDEHGNVKTFDYVAVSRQWNTSLIDDALLERFEKLTGHKPHRWLKRGLFFSHRDFDRCLDLYEKVRRHPFDYCS